jgi:glycosyltransferase involved in cell wall biosynthesis
MPLISVLTPVYNGEKYLAECIESVLSQTFADFEYVIVDNCSTDGTASIAASYAAKDSRIRIHRNPELVPLIDNYNRAAALASDDARYFKYLAADDLLFPECLQKMVAVAARFPTVAVVGSFKIHGSSPVCEGPSYPQEVVSGPDVCRKFFRGTLGYLGGPTNHLLRAPGKADRQHLFDRTYLHADIELFVRLLKDGADYGFVHQVLTFSREHDESVSASVAHYMGTGLPEFLSIVTKHGRSFSSEQEHRDLIGSFRRRYARFLFRVWLKVWERRIWSFQEDIQHKLGLSMSMSEVIRGGCVEVLASALAPRAAWESVKREYRRAQPHQ